MSEDNKERDKKIKEVLDEMRDMFAKYLVQPKQVCPVCQGKGQVAPNFYRSYEVNPFDTTGGNFIYPQMCRSCQGTGVV